MPLFFWLLLAQSVGQENIDSLLTQARYLYDNRYLADSNFIESKSIWEQIITANPHNEEALRGLSEMNQYLGSHTKNKAEKLHYFENGMALAETLIKVNERNPWGHFWYASNYGEICRVKGILKSLFGLAKIKSEFNRTLELDSLNTDAIYGRAVVYFESPGFAGGDKKKAVEYLKKAIAIEPKFTLPYLELAQYYARVKKYAEARVLLNQLLEINNPKYPSDYFLNDKPKAVKLLAEIKGEK
jgi:tetratricopeptide (TPR) repeat protein